MVSLDDTQAVVELQLAEPLAPDTLARARCAIGPFRPLPVSVQPGGYRAGVFWASALAPLAFPAAPRQRVSHKRVMG